MVEYENECVGCPQGCIHCGRDNTKHLYCDLCGADCEELYVLYGQELCEDCLLDSFDTITLED